MALYRYQAAAASGELVKGEMEAHDQESVIERLHAMGYVPIRAEASASGLKRWLEMDLRLAPKRHRSGDLVLLTQQLAMLLQAGLSVDRALEIAQKVLLGGAERGCVQAVLERVRGGRSLADAMGDQNGFFPSFYIGLVRAGEAGGSLDATLRHLADFLERSQAVREQVKSALIYPLAVIATGCVSIAILFGFVIPRFEPLFQGAGTSIPLLTRIVLAISEGFRNYAWEGIALLGLLAIVWYRQMRRPEFRRRWDGRLLKLPLLGDLVAKIEISRFSRTLGTLLHNGVAPLVALTISQGAVGNAALRNALTAVIDSVKEGKGLSDPLGRTKLFPPLAVQLTRAGEETARLDDMLLKIADIYDQETRRSVERLLALLVPAVTIGLGIVVALVIGSILTAIFSVYNLAF